MGTTQAAGDFLRQLEKHPVVRLHPEFVQHYADFATLVDKSLSDLSDKGNRLEQFRESFKAGKGFSNRRNRNYVSCQIFMLQRHSSRLGDFLSEVHGRLFKILGPSGVPRPKWLPDVDVAAGGAKRGLFKGGKALSLPEIRVDAHFRVAVPNVERTRPSRSSLSSESSLSSAASAGESEDSFNASRTEERDDALPEDPPPQSVLDGKSEKLLKLMADIEKMKRRCKHILDVTDKFCILTPESLSVNEVDGSEISAARKSPAEPSPNLVKVTLESIGSHLAVFTKTYTSRHSTGASSPKSPGEF